MSSRVELYCTVIEENEESLLCDFGEDDPIWVAKRMIDFDYSEVQEEGDEGNILIPEWFAIEESLV